MQLSPIGQYANQLIMDITIVYPHVEIPLFVIMPNHIHAIIYIDGEAIWDMNSGNALNIGNDGDAMNRVSTNRINQNTTQTNNE